MWAKKGKSIKKCECKKYTYSSCVVPIGELSAVDFDERSGVGFVAPVVLRLQLLNTKQKP